MYELPEERLEDLIDTYYKEVFSGVHEVANFFPLPTAEDFDRLCHSIAEYGPVTPIKRQQSTRLLIDGRSRLLASFVTGVDPIVEDIEPIDLAGYSVAENMARRHLDPGQRAFAALNVRDYYAAEAKKRQNEALARGNETKHGKSSIEVNLPQSTDTDEREPQARDKAAKTVGISGAYVDRAAKIQEYAPELAGRVRAGEMTLNAAFQQAKPLIAEKQPARRKDVETIDLVGVDGKTYPYPKPSGKVRFNPTNDSVGWARWTWNPVTGCEHGCTFCYAREIAHQKRMEAAYPAKFTPVFHQHRLPAPANTSLPSSDDPAETRVFVCSMADLFGKWVPDDWIRQVFNACMAAPDWTYVFLTKWPKRYQMIASLPHAMFGASIIRQADVKRVERDMSAFETTGVKWISLEPMLEPITFTDLSWCDLVVIGSQTRTFQPDVGEVPAFAPEFDWVVDVVIQCRAAGVPYYLKENLANTPGMVLPQTLPVFNSRGGET